MAGASLSTATGVDSRLAGQASSGSAICPEQIGSGRRGTDGLGWARDEVCVDNGGVGGCRGSGGRARQGGVAGCRPCVRTRRTGRCRGAGREGAAGSCRSSCRRRTRRRACRRLVEEIAGALEAVGGRAEAGRVRGRGGGRRLDRRDARGLEAAGGRVPRAEAGPAGGERGAVGGDGGGLPRGDGGVGRDARRRPPERPGRPGRALGRPARPRRRAGVAGEAAGRLVEAGRQPLGEPGAQRGARPVDPRHGVLGADLPARGRAAAADVPRRRTGSSGRS